MTGEDWRDVPGYECQVDPTGQVRGKTGTLKGWLDDDGYRRVHVRRDGAWRQVPVHLLICTAFHGPRPTPDHEVAHGDGDRTRNAQDNLRWASPQEQSDDKVRHGTMAAGEANGQAVLTDDEVRQIRALYRKGDARVGQVGLAARFEVSRLAIQRVVNGTGWTHVK